MKKRLDESDLIAEFVLSLVTSEARSAAIVGDLIEESKSVWRFWLGVGRTFLAQAWREMAANPIAAIQGGTLAILLEVPFFLVLFLLMALSFVIFGFAAGFGFPVMPYAGWRAARSSLSQPRPAISFRF